MNKPYRKTILSQNAELTYINLIKTRIVDSYLCSYYEIIFKNKFNYKIKELV